MSLSKHKETPPPFYDFSEDLLSEIFKRLPVKYVLRCRSVQKSWYHLIKTPMFISLHSNHQKMTSHINPKYLLFHDTNNDVMKVGSDDAQCQVYCTFDYSLHDLPDCSWYAQSNGLMCMSNMLDYDPSIYIWNPLVQKFKTVPDSPLSTYKCKEIRWHALAFGFLPEVDDYVVVHIVKPKSTSHVSPKFPYDKAYEQYPHSVMIGVYSLNTNSWKKLRQDKVFVDSMSVDQSVFVNGTAFWAGFISQEIYQLVMFFNTKTNILQTVMLPRWIVGGECQLYNRLLPFGQSISYFLRIDEDDADVDIDEEDCTYPRMDMWVLENEMRGWFPWERKMSVSLSENVWPEVLGIRNNGEPILAKSNNLISYDLDTHEPHDFVESCDRLKTYSYSEEGSKSSFVISPFVETLVLLDID